MEFIRYTFNSESCSSSRGSVSVIDNKNKVYDDVVDRSSFRPDSEHVRAFQLTGSGAVGSPQYDEHPEDVSQLELEIRSGKLDKAEISQLQKIKFKEAEEATSKAKAEKVAKETEKINKARQDYLDEATGFKGSPQSDK